MVKRKQKKETFSQVEVTDRLIFLKNRMNYVMNRLVFLEKEISKFHDIFQETVMYQDRYVQEMLDVFKKQSSEAVRLTKLEAKVYGKKKKT